MWNYRTSKPPKRAARAGFPVASTRTSAEQPLAGADAIDIMRLDAVDGGGGGAGRGRAASLLRHAPCDAARRRWTSGGHRLLVRSRLPREADGERRGVRPVRAHRGAPDA